MIFIRLRAVYGVGLVAGMLAACLASSEPDAVAVRLENASDMTFDEATLYTLDGPQTYTGIEPGAATPYVAVSAAYRIATTRVVVDSDTLRLQVIDYVGETPLSDGRYTYVLTVTTGSGTPVLSQALRRDD